MATRNNGNGTTGNKNNGNTCNNSNSQPKSPSNLFTRLSPQQLVVIAALLADALTVDSILIDKNQQIQIVLGGSFRKKTKTDRLLNEISTVSVNDLLDALQNRLSQ